MCWAPVLDLREGLGHPQVIGRAMRVIDGEGSEHLGVPIRFAEEPAQPSVALPALGADGRDLLRRAGMDDGEIDRLIERRILAAP